MHPSVILTREGFVLQLYAGGIVLVV